MLDPRTKAEFLESPGRQLDIILEAIFPIASLEYCPQFENWVREAMACYDIFVLKLYKVKLCAEPASTLSDMGDSARAQS